MYNLLLVNTTLNKFRNKQTTEEHMQVQKRSGQLEDINIDKLHKVVQYACDGITGVSPSEVEINSQIQLYTGITSTDIQETLIKSAADLISEETPNYQYVAGP